MIAVSRGGSEGGKASWEYNTVIQKNFYIISKFSILYRNLSTEIILGARPGGKSLVSLAKSKALWRNKMAESIMAEIFEQYRNTHENLLDLIGSLTDEQIGWTPNETTPSVGFHVWHLARWADYLQEMINGRGSQLWEKEELAARWDMETASLGYAQTGMSMDDKDAMTLRMPRKELLLDYARRAFATAQHAVKKIGDKDFYKIYEGLHGENWHDGHIGPIISTWMTHDNRHLGMIECLVGVQGMHGSADS